MTWNESNNDQNQNQNQNDWNNNSGNGGPPDLDKLIKQFLGKFGFLFGFKMPNRPSTGGGSGKGLSSLLGVIIFIALIAWAVSGIYIVGPAEQAVVLRLGKYNETTGPGPHWIPRFIDSKTIVNVQTISSFQFDADVLTQSSNGSNQPKQIEVKGMSASNSTGDDTGKNVVHVELSVQYRVSDPMLFLYNIVNAPQTLQLAAQSALTEVVGTMQLNDVLTIGRDELAIRVTKQLDTLMTSYQAGIDIVVVNVRKAEAPEEVADAFLDVVQAGQDQERYVQQAQAYASKVVPIAEGVKARMLADASAYKEKVVLNAKANIATYDAIYNVYKKSPAITRERLYLDTMQAIMSNTSKVLVDSKQANNLMYLPLDKLNGQASGKSRASASQSGSADVNEDEAAHSSALPSDDLYKAMYSRLNQSSKGGLS